MKVLIELPYVIGGIVIHARRRGWEARRIVRAVIAGVLLTLRVHSDGDAP